MKRFSKNFVIAVSLAFAVAGCGGSGDEDTFTQEQAIEATKFALGAYLIGSLVATFQLDGESGDFDAMDQCELGGTARFSGSIVVESEIVTMMEMDIEASACRDASGTIDGALHFESTAQSVDVAGSYTFSGDILSGTCSFDLSATFSADRTSFDVTGTACGQDVSGRYTMTDSIDG